jgi:hypothetical protein
MSTAVSHAPVVVLGAPSKPRALYAHKHSFRQFVQGAGTAVLAYAGAGSMVGGVGDAAGAGPALTDFASLEGITQNFVEGHLTGPAQLLAGALLFILAGKSSARVIGLFAGLLIMYLYSQGVTLDDVWAYVQSLFTRFGAAASAFQNPGAPSPPG